MKTVVVVDDSVLTRESVKLALKKGGYDVIGEAGDGETALEVCMRLKPDIITLDNILPDMFGIQILQSLKEQNVQSKFIMISGVSSQRMIDKVKSMGASGYLVKPIEVKQLITICNRLMYKAQVA